MRPPEASQLPRLLLIPRAVGINFVGLAAVLALKLPIFLDTTGTFLAAVLAGPVVAMIVGASTSLVAALSIDPTALPFALVQMVVGFVAGWLARFGFFERLSTTVLAGVITALAGASVASVIVVFVFGGVTSSGTVMITAVLVAVGNELYTSVLSTQVFTDTADKIIVALLVFWLVKRLPRRTREMYGAVRSASG